MKILERHIKTVSAGSMKKQQGLEKKYAAVEARLGYPKTRWFIVHTGTSPMGTRVLEREWESMAAMEATLVKAIADPEWQALYAESVGLDATTKVELLRVNYLSKSRYCQNPVGGEGFEPPTSSV